jgi:hypothetical protein
LFPVVALIERSDAHVLPTAREHGLAVQRPAAYATCVVLAPPGPHRELLAAGDVGRTDRPPDSELPGEVCGVRGSLLRGADRPPGSVSGR